MFQCIMAFYDQSRTYLIRTLSDYLVRDTGMSPVSNNFILYYIMFSINFPVCRESKSKFLSFQLLFNIYTPNGDTITADKAFSRNYAAGKRFISDISEPRKNSKIISFVSEEENCDIFTC